MITWALKIFNCDMDSNFWCSVFIMHQLVRHPPIQCRMDRYMKNVHKGKVKADPELIKLWGTNAGRDFDAYLCQLVLDNKQGSNSLSTMPLLSFLLEQHQANYIKMMGCQMSSFKVKSFEVFFELMVACKR